jgi:hypothetical protein
MLNPTKDSVVMPFPNLFPQLDLQSTKVPLVMPYPNSLPPINLQSTKIPFGIVAPPKLKIKSESIPNSKLSSIDNKPVGTILSKTADTSTTSTIPITSSDNSNYLYVSGVLVIAFFLLKK